jgi:hypothetical protein
MPSLASNVLGDFSFRRVLHSGYYAPLETCPELCERMTLLILIVKTH